MAEVYRQAIQSMSDRELIELASSLKIPLVKTTMEREELKHLIQSDLERRYTDPHTDLSSPLFDPAVRLESVRKTFGKTVALERMDLVVRPGEIVGLIGPNGAGKTTTVRILVGIIRASSGRVTVNGHDMRHNAIAAKYRIAYLPERPTCYPSLRVREYLTFIARVYGVPRHDALIRMHTYAHMFTLNELMSSYVGTLSKGNLQRMLIVGLLLRPPPLILVLDEPFQGLDPIGAWSLKQMMIALREQGSAILISTHVLQVAEAICDRFVIIDRGVVVDSGTIRELNRNASEERTLEEIFLARTGRTPS